MYKTIGINEIADMLEGIDNNEAKRIIMEKESRGITYKDLLENMVKRDEKYRTYDENSLRKALQSKKISKDLIYDLNHVLELKEADLSENMAVYRYNKKFSLKKGRHSKSKLEEDKKKYDESHIVHDPENGIYDMDRLLVEAMTTQEVYKIGDDTFDSYFEYASELEDRDMLRRMFLIFYTFPQEVKKFMEQFVFNEDEKMQFDKIDIQIKYR